MSAQDELSPRTSKFLQSVEGINQSTASIERALDRSAAQDHRDRASGPVSDERREIQAIGRRAMRDAIAEFKARNGIAQPTMQERHFEHPALPPHWLPGFQAFCKARLDVERAEGSLRALGQSQSDLDWLRAQSGGYLWTHRDALLTILPHVMAGKDPFPKLREASATVDPRDQT